MNSRVRVVLILTPAEARMLDLVANNGWGDGEFGTDWISNKRRADICANAIQKLKDACRRPARRIKCK